MSHKFNTDFVSYDHETGKVRIAAGDTVVSELKKALAEIGIVANAGVGLAHALQKEKIQNIDTPSLTGVSLADNNGIKRFVTGALDEQELAGAGGRWD
jgi:hypothetical protein